MTAISDKLARDFLPNGDGETDYARIHRFISGGMVTPEEGISALLDFAYRRGVSDSNNGTR